ncbi:hypothetical protein [Pedobacter riviphilus]|uniref:hypothetical protein n=1 Tax=Pedobacter riviphilus TaxID=2766984 RepID=UPI001CC237F6|nr:hypothetical protein [Pedobacter riviphilus]
MNPKRIYALGFFLVLICSLVYAVPARAQKLNNRVDSLITTVLKDKEGPGVYL